MPDIASAIVRSTNYFGADQFDVALRLDADSSFWSDQAPIEVDIGLRLDASSDYVSVIQGRADSVRLDPVAHVVHVAGRDYSALLIDSIVSETFTNRTASEVATLLAQRHGLTPAVTSTASLVGRYYQSQHDSISLDTFCGKASEWDLLCFLAQKESCDLFVSGRVLNFQPADTSQNGYYSIGLGDVTALKLERNLLLSGNVEVTVKTWNSRQHAADIQTASRNVSASMRSDQSARRQYVIVRPNLTSDEAQQLAQRKLSEICVHSRSIELVMPGELTLSPRNVVMLQGTCTTFDQSYKIDFIERQLTSGRGFVQIVRCSSLPPD